MTTERDSSESKELKPCPFCGGEAALMKDEPDNRYCDEYRIMCFSGECGVAPDHVFENKHEAVKAWNTRPLEQSLQAALISARDALEKIAEARSPDNDQLKFATQSELRTYACDALNSITSLLKGETDA